MGQGWVRKEAMILRCSWIKLCSTALLQPLGSIGCEATLTAWLHPVSKLEEEIGVPLTINLCTINLCTPQQLTGNLSSHKQMQLYTLKDEFIILRTLSFQGTVVCS